MRIERNMNKYTFLQCRAVKYEKKISIFVLIYGIRYTYRFFFWLIYGKRYISILWLICGIRYISVFLADLWYTVHISLFFGLFTVYGTSQYFLADLWYTYISLYFLADLRYTVHLSIFSICGIRYISRRALECDQFGPT